MTESDTNLLVPEREQREWRRGALAGTEARTAWNQGNVGPGVFERARRVQETHGGRPTPDARDVARTRDGPATQWACSESLPHWRGFRANTTPAPRTDLVPSGVGWGPTGTLSR